MSDRQIIAPSIEFTIACRNSYGSTMSSATPATKPITEKRSKCSGRGASGHELKRQRGGVQRDQRCDEDAERAGDDAGEQRVEQRQAARRLPGVHRVPLAFRRGPG